MRQYIVNLTDHLISKNRYDEAFCKIKDQKKLIRHVALDLETGDVRSMSPAKLGEIMCSFESGDVMTSQEDLFKDTCFGGDCDMLLRSLVSVCLAYVIRDRLDEDRCPIGVPRWRGRIPGMQSGFRNIIDSMKEHRTK